MMSDRLKSLQRMGQIEVAVFFSSEWTELGYCMARMFDSFIPRRLMKAQHLLYVAILKDFAKVDKDQSCASLLPSSSIDY